VTVSGLIHAGAFNVAIAALTVWGIARARRSPLIALAIAAIGFAIVVNGLLAPDPETRIGRPGDGWRLTIDTLELVHPHPVVQIDVADERGGHLTITQPTGTAFLSPVLLMQQKQQIAGLDVPYDSFAVPAAHRIVKAVLLSGAEAAVLPRVAELGGSAVLFDLEDETGTAVPHGIAVAGSGQWIEAGGLRLRPTILNYPAITTYAIPNLAALGAGIAALLIGLLLTRRAPQGKMPER
jgi:hypothetical protein